MNWAYVLLILMNNGVIGMFQKFKLPIFILFWVVIILVLFDIGINDKNANVVAESEVIPEHQELNQKPEPLEMKRSGSDVYLKMNAQITDIEIKDGVTYKAWTFNGEAPGQSDLEIACNVSETRVQGYSKWEM